MATNDTTKSLDQMWREAQQNFLKETGQDIGQQPGRMDDLMSKLADAYGPLGDSAAVAKAQRVIQDMMKIFQLIGGLACQAASTMFSPAGMCFNAVSFLIDGVKRMKKLNSDLISMFESIKSFLEEFKMLQRIEGQYREVDLTNLPMEIISNTNKLMCSFVNLLAHTYKAMIRGKFKRTMVGLRVAFTEDDGGVAAELSHFQSLVKKQDSLKGTITLEEVMKSRSDIKTLLEKAAEDHMINISTHEDVVEIKNDMNAKNEKSRSDTRLEELAKRLGISGKNKEKKEYNYFTQQKEVLDETKKRRAFQSGAWLEKHESYTSWREAGRQASPVLFLTGRRGSGKSVLASKVIEDCTPSASMKDPVAVAYYFFGDNDDRRDAGEKDEFTSALCCMAYMLAKNNARYALDLTQAQDWKDDKELKTFSPEKVWKALRFSADRETTFVLIFDGIDQLTNGEEYMKLIHKTTCDNPHSESLNITSAKPILSAVPTMRSLRVMMSVTETNTEDMLRGKNAEVIRLSASADEEDGEPLNADDLRQYIDERINAEGRPLAELSKNPAHKALLDEFRKHLLRLSNGEYAFIASRVDNVNRHIDDGSESIDALREVMLSNQRDDQASLAKKVLEGLEFSLTPREIAQINDMLVWTVWSLGEEMTFEQIDAAAAINRDSASVLQSFSQKLKSKKKEYLDLFSIAKDGSAYGDPSTARVIIKSELIDFLRQMEWDGDQTAETEVKGPVKPKISLTIKIEAAEPKAVRRFLWDLHEKITYNQSFFASGDNEVLSRAKIHVDEADSISKLLVQCTELLLAEKETSTGELIQHALYWVPRYVWKASQIEEKKRSKQPNYTLPQRDRIVSNLVAVLSNQEELFVRHLVENWYPRPSAQWFDESENTKAIRDWLSDEKTVKTLPPAQRGDLKKLLKASDGPVGYAYNLTCQVAKAWISDREWYADEAFIFIDAFLNAQNLYEKPPAPATPAAKDAESKDASESSDAASSKTEDGAEETKPEEEQESDTRVSINVDERIKQAAAWAQKVLKVTERNSLFIERLGETSYYSGSHEKAVESFKEALETTDSPRTVHKWLTMSYAALGQNTAALEEAKKTLEAVEEFLKGEPDSKKEESESLLRETKLLVVEKCADAKKTEDALALLDELIKADPHDYESYRKLLGIIWDSKQYDQAKEYLDKLQTTPAKETSTENTELTGFAEYCINAGERWWQKGLETMVQLACQVGWLSQVMGSLRLAADYLSTKDKLEKADRDGKQSLAYIVQHHSRCLFMQDRSPRGFVAATDGFRRCLDILDVHDKSYFSMRCKQQTATYIATYYHSQIAAGQDVDRHTRKIKDLADLLSDAYQNPCASILTHSYLITDQKDKAMEQNRKKIQNGLELLNDDDPDNDWEAYEALAYPLANVNETAYSLAAWSLLNPDVDKYDQQLKEYQSTLTNGTGADEKAEQPNGVKEEGEAKPNGSAELPTFTINGSEMEADSSLEAKGSAAEEEAKKEAPTLKGPQFRYCDANCGKEWSYPDDMWKCRLCWDVDLCTPCNEKLGRDELEMGVCHTSHPRYYLPKWSREEYERVGKGRVCIPKQTAPDVWSREEGEIIDVKEWEDRIRTLFNIEKPVPVVTGTEEMARAKDDLSIVLKPLSETKKRAQTFGV